MKDTLGTARETVKQSLKSSRRARLLRRAYLARKGYPDWRNLIGSAAGRWNEVLDAAQRGPKVLVATSVGSHLPGTTLESVLAAALTLRGAEVHTLLCDSRLPACLACDVTWYPKQELFAKSGPQGDLCKHCFEPAQKMYGALLPHTHRYSDWLGAEDLERAEELSSSIPLDNIRGYELGGLAVGEHALAGSLRYYARADLEGEPYGEVVLRRYFRAALLTSLAIQNLLDELHFECAIFHHGIYVPQGLIGEVARHRGIRVVNWNPAYRKKCFIFSHGDTYHHTLMTEPTGAWEEIVWTSELEEETLSYLKSRWQGTQDWIWFHERPQFDLEAITREVGVDFSKPCIGMLTNVMWDAQLHYPANAFPNMLAWTLDTIQYFAERPDLQLLIRVHPAEIRGTLPSRQPIVEEIRRRFPVLPDNVFVVPPESQVSTYAAMSECNAVIIYGTKTGVELTSMGIPVIVAGEAWIRNKGLTMDARTVEEYFHLLGKLPLADRMDKATMQRARKYAYHFFFRRMIPLEAMAPAEGWPPYQARLGSLQDLAEGSCRGLDIVCDGILNGTDFIYPAEKMKDCGGE